MSNELLPVSGLASNRMHWPMAQQTFRSTHHNSPTNINRYFHADWGFGPVPETVDASAAIGGGRVGDIVPTDECSFSVEIIKVAAWGSAVSSQADFTFSSVTSTDVTQTITRTTGDWSLASFAFVPGWNGAAPASGTELWAPRYGYWHADVSYYYNAATSITPQANVDLLFRTLATTIASQSQTATPFSHPTTGGTVSFEEDVEILAHPLWLPLYNLLLVATGTAYNALADGTTLFTLDASFERLGDSSV